MCNIHTARQCIENKGVTCEKDCPNLCCPMNKDHDPKATSYSRDKEKPYYRTKQNEKLEELMKKND